MWRRAPAAAFAWVAILAACSKGSPPVPDAAPIADAGVDASDAGEPDASDAGEDASDGGDAGDGGDASTVATAVPRRAEPDAGPRAYVGPPQEHAVPFVTANVQIGSVILTPSRPGGIEAVARAVNILKPRLRTCYTNALASNPSLVGSVSLRCQATPDGDCRDVTVATSNLPMALTDCARLVVKTLRLPASDRASTVTIPVRFDEGI